MAKKQSLRSRNSRKLAELGLDSEFSTAKSDNLSGKTIVRDKIAELSVRGVIGDDDEVAVKDKRKPASVPVSGGISKKQKQKALSHKQKLRRAQAIERGEKITEQLQEKVAYSKEREQQIKQRKKTWEKVNEEIKDAQKSTSANGFEALAD